MKKNQIIYGCGDIVAFKLSKNSKQKPVGKIVACNGSYLDIEVEQREGCTVFGVFTVKASSIIKRLKKYDLNAELWKAYKKKNTQKRSLANGVRFAEGKQEKPKKEKKDYINTYFHMYRKAQ